MPNVTASIPHQLSRAEAKQRIQHQLGQVRQQPGALLANLQETWNGDRMVFSLRTMGQLVSGSLTVEDHAVRLDVAVPWLLSMAAGPIKQRIEQDVQRLLSAPTREAG